MGLILGQYLIGVLGEDLVSILGPILVTHLHDIEILSPGDWLSL